MTQTLQFKGQVEDEIYQEKAKSGMIWENSNETRILPYVK